MKIEKNFWGEWESANQQTKFGFPASSCSTAHRDEQEQQKCHRLDGDQHCEEEGMEV